MDRKALFVAGKWETTDQVETVTNPFSGDALAQVSQATADVVERALTAATAASSALRAEAAFERRQRLERIAEVMTRREGDFVEVLVAEVGKTIAEAENEVGRAIMNVRYAAEEAIRIHGEVVPLDISEKGRGRTAIVKRFPIGLVTAITPFNFPLNLPVHKVAPALAVGNPVILKPAPQTPLSGLLLAEVIEEAGIPTGGFQVLPGNPPAIGPLVTDERVRMVSFTGSAMVGWKLKAAAVHAKVTLELGGNAAVIVHEDADLEDAADKCFAHGVAVAGQVCIRPQRLLVHEPVLERFRSLLKERFDGARPGDPRTARLGPVIDETNALRLQEWVDEAVGGGAKVVSGGPRQGRLFPATLLEDVDHGARVWREEVFGPVSTLESYQDFDEAIRLVNDTRYGLQTGVFTARHDLAMRAFNELEVGGVVIDNTSALRVDNMPYGGVRHSGFGREGVRYAIEDMTEPKVLLMPGA